MLRYIQHINNSDKGSGNTLQLSSQATGKNQKSTVSECIITTILKERKSVIINFLIIIQVLKLIFILTTMNMTIQLNLKALV